tara:strand:- start:2197 stop:2409 length:213 start_codon:yes stop_codon:yes gene_type:complete
MSKFRVVKQLYPAPSSSADPSWAMRDVFVGKISGSVDQIWEFEREEDAYMKMYNLSGSDDTGRRYKVVEL